MRYRNLIVLPLIFSFFYFAASGQSGGSFAVTQSVIAGGGQNSAGGTYGVIGAIGQPAAGALIFGGQFVVQGGFWTPEQLVPTAAPVSVSGRITSPDGVQLSRVFVELLNVVTGETRSARPSTFGHFRFHDVQVGLYVLRARSRTYTFAPAETVVDLTQDLAGVEFVAMPISP